MRSGMISGRKYILRQSAEVATDLVVFRLDLAFRSKTSPTGTPCSSRTLLAICSSNERSVKEVHQFISRRLNLPRSRESAFPPLRAYPVRLGPRKLKQDPRHLSARWTQNEMTRRRNAYRNFSALNTFALNAKCCGATWTNL
jgi:hypothetical protein